jgi:hypothetical protein
MDCRQVWVDNWQMQCCGDPISVGSTISWTVMPPDHDYLTSVLGDAGAARVTDAEEHHGGDEGRESRTMAGTVRSIEAVVCRYAPGDRSDSGTLVPVAGSEIITPLTAADGWESEVDGSADDVRFVGYIVGVDTN